MYILNIYLSLELLGVCYIKLHIYTGDGKYYGGQNILYIL